MNSVIQIQFRRPDHTAIVFIGALEIFPTRTSHFSIVIFERNSSIYREKKYFRYLINDRIKKVFVLKTLSMIMEIKGAI